MRIAKSDATASLFPDMPPARAEIPVLPPGFQYRRDFLTPAEEAELIAHIETGVELRNSKYQAYTALRRTASFSLRWGKNAAPPDAAYPHAGPADAGPSTAPAAPEFLAALAEKVARAVGRAPRDFPHALVTQYPPGAPMGWHRDAPPYAQIHGVSLAADCDFRLRPFEPEKQTREAIIHLNCERRSLYVMAGESRSRWQHSVAPLKALRYSITLRTLR